MNLLIIDDEIETINGIMTGVCWDNHHFKNIAQATCVEEGMQVFNTQRIDIVLCDIEMPDGSGLDLLEWVRENYKDTICIILTCHEEFSYAKRAIALECKDYILKPVLYMGLETKLLETENQIIKRKENSKYQEYGRDWMEKINNSENEQGTYLSKTEVTEQVKTYIRTHLKEELQLDIVAGEIHISQDYLSRIFKKMEGITVSDFIVNERMFLAGELLKRGSLSISRVAYECGYDNFSYFTKIFKKKYGVTPREYRQKC